LDLQRKYRVETVAVGDGTAGRETESFVRKVLKIRGTEVMLVDESGASIYSASEVGREEFPDLDLTIRGAISIGRRLMDPLAELVKLDPKNIGVGQYQHDVAQDLLKQSLSDTVLFAVNKVGVDLNTASEHLLTYVSGLGPGLAKKVIAHRKAQGRFDSRNELKSVKGFGPKAFEQSAGFLRINDGSNPLDTSAVHPERYPFVNKLARELKLKPADLIGRKGIQEEVEQLGDFAQEVGVYSLQDILNELEKPGRDPRGETQTFEFDDAIRNLEDVKRNMILNGRVTNLTKFGAFVDIGVKQDGMIHISQISDRRIADPSEVLRLGQAVRVRVTEVDEARQRIGLSLKNIDG